MPYIEQRRRHTILHNEMVGLETPGELNFAITHLIDEYRADHGDCYQTYNDILGALEGASKEFYRRVVAPYEDKKIIENGDIYYGTKQQTKAAEPPQELRRQGVEL